MGMKEPKSDRTPSEKSGRAESEELRRLHQDLLRTIRRICAVCDAEDVVQEAILRLHKVERERVVKDRAAFLLVVAMNLVRDRFRADATRRRYVEQAMYIDPRAIDYPSVDLVLAGRERLVAVGRALAELPEKSRLAFVRHRLDQSSQMTIAAELNISKSMVEKHVSRAVRHCQVCLAAFDRLTA